MKRLSLYGIAVAFGHYLACEHKGTESDVVLYRIMVDVLAFVAGWLDCTEYQREKAIKMMDSKCIQQLANIKRSEDASTTS